MINVIVREGLYDEPFAREWTTGFEELRAYVSRFTPEHASSITGVPPQVIRSVARDIAAAQGAALLVYSGLEYYEQRGAEHPGHPHPVGAHR